MNEPDLYAENNILTLRATETLFKKYKELMKFNENESILEFGIGDGKNTKEAFLPHIPNTFNSYVALDNSRDFLNIAKQNITNPKVEFIEMDISDENLPIIFERKFDHIFSFFVMHWIWKPRQTFINIHKILNPGGEIFLIFFERSPNDYALDALSKMPKWKKYEHEKMLSAYYHSPDPQKEWEKDLIAVGFKDYVIKKEPGTFHFPSKDSFENIMFAVNPVLKNVSPEELDEYKKDYLKSARESEIYFEETKNGNTTVGWNYNLIIVFAKKSK